MFPFEFRLLSLFNSFFLHSTSSSSSKDLKPICFILFSTFSSSSSVSFLAWILLIFFIDVRVYERWRNALVFYSTDNIICCSQTWRKKCSSKRMANDGEETSTDVSSKLGSKRWNQSLIWNKLNDIVWFRPYQKRRWNSLLQDGRLCCAEPITVTSALDFISSFTHIYWFLQRTSVPGVMRLPAEKNLFEEQSFPFVCMLWTFRVWSTAVVMYWSCVQARTYVYGMESHGNMHATCFFLRSFAWCKDEPPAECQTFIFFSIDFRSLSYCVTKDNWDTSIPIRCSLLNNTHPNFET